MKWIKSIYLIPSWPLFSHREQSGESQGNLFISLFQYIQYNIQPKTQISRSLSRKVQRIFSLEDNILYYGSVWEWGTWLISWLYTNGI